MSEKLKENQKYLKDSNLSEREKFEAKQNLVGFFDLLLKIDIRKNPEKYKKPKEKND